MQMTPNLTRAVWLFLISQTFILLSGYLMFAMIGEVNRKTAETQRVSYLLGYLAKYAKVLREYRRLYPGGRLALYFSFCLAVGLAMLTASAWQLGMFR
jgi:hypothetical protein